MAEKKRRARGEGSIRQRKDGTWEARFVIGIDPGTGKEIRKSVYAKTQKEVRKKMTEAVAALDKDDYREPSKMTLAHWLNIWSAEYWNDIKESTCASYRATIKNHIIPNLGAVKLDSLNAHTIQQFLNSLSKEQDGHIALNPKTVHNVHGVLHKALAQAVAIGYLRSNPTDACTLPKKIHKKITPLDENTMAAFLDAIKGHRFEYIYLTTVFTGMRRGEVCGLTWDCVDFVTGSITINKQLKKERGVGGAYVLPLSTKNDKARTIVPAPFVMDILKAQKIQQAKWRLKAGPAWEGCPLGDMVFTDELGHHLVPDTVYENFKRVMRSLGFPETRLHDLRHTFAVASIRAGDDIKTVQGNLGHATAAFTLDVYGHATDQMKRDSADRMQQYIERMKKSS